MKKRKPPIVAITLLILFGAVAAVFNYAQGVDPKADAQQAQQAAQKNAEAHVGDPRPTTDAKATASAVQAQLGAAGAPAKGGPPHGHPGGPGGKFPGSENPIAVPKFANQKPVPNDSSVSSQWYHSDSAKPSGG